MSLPHQLTGLTDREAITDVIHRAVIGVDLNDGDLFASAFVPEAEFVMAERTIKGLAAMREGMFKTVGPMDTHHLVVNVRIEVKPGASTAVATAYSQNQHFRPGEGLSEGAKQLIAGGRYDMDFVKDAEGLWKMSRWGFVTVWRQGDRSVMG